MVEGEVQAHLGLYGASGCQRHLSRRLIFNLDMGLDMKRALSGNGERLSTQIRALARQ
jgi:hypothetical protein